MKRSLLILLCLAQSVPTCAMLQSHQRPLLELSERATNDSLTTNSTPHPSINESRGNAHNATDETDYSDPAYDNAACLPRCCFRLDDAVFRLNRCARMAALLGYCLTATSVGLLVGYIQRRS